MTTKNRYNVKIEGLDGHGKRRYFWMTFSTDLQRALRQYTIDHGLDAATQYLRGALIVYPLGPYTSQTIPPMGLGRIIYVQRQKRGFSTRPRAQFIMPDRWRGNDDQDIRDALVYVQHDYDFWSRQQIAADLAHWRQKYDLAVPFWTWPRGLVRRVNRHRARRQLRFLLKRD